jgi:hypothetical protein
VKQDINNELDSELSSNVAYEILDYLAHNPNAEGSIESIAEWWLLEQRINKEMEGIMKAVQQLVENHLLVERRSEDMKVYYSVNREKLNQILELLNKKMTANGH